MEKTSCSSWLGYVYVRRYGSWAAAIMNVECEQGSHIRSSHTNMLSEFAAAKNLSIYVPVKIDFLVKYYLGLGSRPREDR